MPIKEPYLTRSRHIGQRLIELEARSPGTVRMRANPDGFVVSAMVEKLKPLGFKKGFFQSSQQFIYDSFLTYPRAVEACLPYSLLVGPDSVGGHEHCWAGVGMYLGWFGTFAIDKFFQSKTLDLDGMLLMVLIKPFFGQISDLLDPFPEKKPIPAPDPERHWLVRKLILHRLQSQPLCASADTDRQHIENLPIEVLKQTCEFSILIITEQYHGLLDGCGDEATSIELLNKMHADNLSLGGLKLPVMDPPFTLRRYVRHYLDAGFNYGAPMSDPFIVDAIQMIEAFYKR